MRVFREIRDMGMLRAIFVMAAIVPLVALFLYHRLSTVQSFDYAVFGVLFLLTFIIHRNRKDYYFLSKLSYPPAYIFFAEYLVFSSPVLVLSAVFGQYLQVLIYIVLLLALCFVKPSRKKTKTKYNAWVKHIPAAMFEWQSGFRANMPVIVFFYCLGLAGIFNIWISAVSIALLLQIFSTFYSINESQKILAAPEQNAEVFLRCKLTQHVKYWTLFLLPLFLVAFVHYEYWAFILAAFAASVNLQVFAILAKYAYYRPVSTGVLSQIVVPTAWLCSVILPVSVLVFFGNFFVYRKAKNNLKYYLNAYN
jgi:hypothetical protein